MFVDRDQVSGYTNAVIYPRSGSRHGRLMSTVDGREPTTALSCGNKLRE